METTPVVGLLLLTGKEGKRACHLASEAQRWANRHCKVPLILNFPDLSNNQYFSFAFSDYKVTQ